MAHTRPLIRLFVSAPLGEGLSADLAADQVHYLRHVMRHGPGDEVLLFNGRDGEWLAGLDSLDRRGGTAAILSRRRPQCSTSGPTLLFAPLKKSATDFLVEKATELGVSRLSPVLTARTQTRRVNLDRLWANCIEAAEQCERLTIPDLDPVTPLDEVLRPWSGTTPLLLADETGGGRRLVDVLPDLAVPPAFLIGPEGGFTKSELDLLGDKDFVTSINLGPRILRAETAALAVLSCWQALAGDGAEAPWPRTAGDSIDE